MQKTVGRRRESEKEREGGEREGKRERERGWVGGGNNMRETQSKEIIKKF